MLLESAYCGDFVLTVFDKCFLLLFNCAKMCQASTSILVKPICLVNHARWWMF